MSPGCRTPCRRPVVRGDEQAATARRHGHYSDDGVCRGLEIVLGPRRDSRGYLFSQGELRQLTQDTLWSQNWSVGRPVAGRGGRPSIPPRRHQRTWRQPARGPRRAVAKLDLEPGDVLLLCSDGLTEMVKDEQISAVLGNGDDPSDVLRLVTEANENGGKDNVTVVVGSSMTAEWGRRESTSASESPVEVPPCHATTTLPTTTETTPAQEVRQ